MMNIKEYYVKEYPTDELGVELKDNATFIGLLDTLHTEGDVYEYIGVEDSMVRERLFWELTSILDRPYDYVYALWLK